jgi:hypothetical protein
MSKPQAASSTGFVAEPRSVVKVQRRARPPGPWAWAIHEEGRAEPARCSTRLYRCAEDAWAVGRAVLERLPRSAIKVAAHAPGDGDGDEAAPG